MAESDIIVSLHLVILSNLWFLPRQVQLLSLTFLSQYTKGQNDKGQNDKGQNDKGQNDKGQNDKG
jgi:hypothetical protein